MTERYVKLVNGVEVDMSADEIAQRQAEENAPPALPSLYDRLSAIFSQLADEQQAALGQLAAAVDLALEKNKVNVARLGILNAPIPAELESVRTAMLEEFNRV